MGESHDYNWCGFKVHSSFDKIGCPIVNCSLENRPYISRRRKQFSWISIVSRVWPFVPKTSENRKPMLKQNWECIQPFMSMRPPNGLIVQQNWKELKINNWWGLNWEIDSPASMKKHPRFPPSEGVEEDLLSSMDNNQLMIWCRKESTRSQK